MLPVSSPGVLGRGWEPRIVQEEWLSFGIQGKSLLYGGFLADPLFLLLLLALRMEKGSCCPIFMLLQTFLVNPDCGLILATLGP